MKRLMRLLALAALTRAQMDEELMWPTIFGDGVALARVHIRRGVEAFAETKVDEAIDSFDHAIAALPQLKTQLWQRGLALYYAQVCAVLRPFASP